MIIQDDDTAIWIPLTEHIICPKCGIILAELTNVDANDVKIKSNIKIKCIICDVIAWPKDEYLREKK